MCPSTPLCTVPTLFCILGGDLMLRIYRHLTFGPKWIWTSKVGIMESGEGRRIFQCVPSPHAALPSHCGLVVSLLSGPSRCWNHLPDRVPFHSLALRVVGSSLLLGQAQSHCAPLCDFLKPCLSFAKLF